MSLLVQHPRWTRRGLVQAGAVGLLGLGTNHLAALRSAAAPGTPPLAPRARGVIYIFLSGGLAQHESFDPKPEAPDSVRGEFAPIATRTPGVLVSEHLPMLAARSNQWALVRSLTHRSNDHSQGHHIMLTGRSELPTPFDPVRPLPTDWPAIAAVAGAVTAPRNNLPPAVVLPEPLIHRTGRVLPGQFAGQMGSHRDPWLIPASPFNGQSYGAYPEFGFHHERGAENPATISFEAPCLIMPPGLSPQRLGNRLTLLQQLDHQRHALERAAEVERFDLRRQQAVSLLADGQVRQAIDVARADPSLLDRYGRNAFGWSLLMARRLVAAGVNLVQVNLGNNESWDTHQAAFPNLKDFLLPPTDRGVSALIDDLAASGELDETLIVMAGEFGRTPKISTLPGVKLAGRDHWGAVQSVFLAGGGVQGGMVVGKSDRLGAFPAANPQSPENLAATIYHSLGIPSTAVWHDALDRPHQIYFGQPIKELFG